MPLYDLTSKTTGQTYRIDASGDLSDEDIDWTINEFDQEFYREQGLSPDIAKQGPVATAGTAFFRSLGDAGAATVGGIAKAGAEVERLREKLTGGLIPSSGVYDKVAAFTDAVREEATAVYPTNPANPISNTVGSGAGQAVALLGTAAGAAPVIGGKAALTVVPAVVGAAMGTGEGIDTAKELGIENPAGRLAVGAAFAGIEAGTEKLGGIGGKQASEMIAEGVKATAKEVAKSVGSEAIEEPISGTGQEAVTWLAGQTVADPSRPGFTQSGAQLPKAEGFFGRRAHEAIGGAAGGIVFGGVQVLAGRGASSAAVTQVQPPPLPAGEDLGDITADDVADLEASANPPPAPAPALRPALPVDVPAPRPLVPGFRDNPLTAPVPPSGGNLIHDFGIAKTPNAQAVADAANEEYARNNAALQVQKGAPTKARIPDSPLGSYDILDFLNENPLQVARRGSEQEGQAGYDWQERYSIPLYYRKFIAASGRGHAPDTLVGMAQDAGFPQVQSADDLMSLVQSTINERTQYRVQFRQRDKALKQEAQQVSNFEKDQARAGQRDKTLVALEDVQPGDEFTINGENAKVKKVEWNDDGYLTNVVIEDGKRYGVLNLDAQSRAGVFVDEWTPKKRETAGAEADPFEMTSVTDEELAAEKERARQRAEIAARQSKALTGNAGEFGTPDMLDPTAGDMALFSQPQKGFKILAPSRQGGYLTDAHIDGMITLATAALRSGQSFALWAGDMLQRFGASVQGGLRAAWQAAQKLGRQAASRMLQVDTAKHVRMGQKRTQSGNLGKGGFRMSFEGPAKVEETRSRMARPDAQERLYETRADVVVKATAEAWLDSTTPEQAVSILESGKLPDGMTGDVAQQAAGLLIQRTTAALNAGSELEQMQARALGHRIAKVWQGWLSQEAGRTLRQRAVVNAELQPIAPVLAAEGLLIDRADAVLGQRFEGGASAAAAKVEGVAEKAAEDASEQIERILSAVLGPRLGPRATVAEAMAALLGGKTQRDQLLDDVAQALMLKAKTRVVTPARQTALAALAASLKRTLGASVQGEAIKAPPQSLGEALARAFVDQVAEADTFRQAWEAGRQRVFDMLFDMELDKAYHPARLRRAAASSRLQHLAAGNDQQVAEASGEMAQLRQDVEQLTAEMEAAGDAAAAKTEQFWAEVDRLMPSTPAMAYAPGVAREAVKRGFEQAGYTAELATGMDKSGKRKLSMKDALNDRARAVAAVLRVWDSEANAAGISPQAWAQARGIATAAINESLDQWQEQLDKAETRKADDQRARLLQKDSPALAKLLAQIRSKVAPDMSWSDIFTDMPGTQKERQREIYRRLLQHDLLKGLSADERLGLTNELNKAWQRERQEVFKRELKRAGVMGEKDSSDAEKVIRVLPKLIRMLNLGMFNSEMFREAVAPEYGLRQLSSAEAVKLRTMAEKAYEQPEGMLRDRELTKLLFAIRNLTGTSWVDLVSSYWTAAVLSGLRTMWDTFLAASNGLLTNTLQSAGQLLQGRGQAALDIQAQWWRSFFEGVREAAVIIGTGDRSYAKRFGADLQKALAGERNHGPLPLGEMLWQSENQWLKYGMAPIMLWTGRLMEAADHINNTATTEGAKVVARAMRPDLYQRAAWSDQERADARLQALREVTGGRQPSTMTERADVAKRTREILSQGLMPEDLESANTVGDMAAFQNDPTGFFGGIYNMMKTALHTGEESLRSAADDVTTNKVARVLMAALGGSIYGLTGTRFMRFGFNFGAEITRYMPGSFSLQYLGFYGRQTSAQERQLLLGKNIVGLFVLATLAAQFGGSDGEDDEWHLEGDWSSLSPDEQRQRMTAGIGRLSMWRRVNGRVQSVSYKQWPTMGLFAAVGSMADERRYKPEVWKQRSVAGHMLRAGLSGLFQVQNVSAMRGLVEAFGSPQVASDPVTEWVERLTKLGTNYAGGFMPTLVKDAETWSDPRNFKPEGVAEQLIRAVPFARKTVNDGRPQLNLLGEEVTLQRAPWSRTYTSVETGEAHRVLGALLARGLSLPEADTSKKLKIAGKEMTIKEIGKDAEWRYQKAVGQAYRAWLATEGQALLQMNDVGLQKVISRRADVIRAQAANSLRK